MINFRMRKYFLRAFLPFFLVTAALIPRDAFAFVPANIGGYGLPSPASVSTASAGATAAGAVGAVDLFAALALVTIGATIGYFAVDYAVGGQNYVARIPLSNSSALAVPAPAALPSAAQTFYWTSGGAGSQTAANVCSGGSLSGYIGSDANQACHVFVCLMGQTSQNGYSPYADSSVTSVNGSTAACSGHITFNNSLVPVSGTLFSSLACPSGYTVSGLNCVLANARLAQPDNACDLARSGSALAMISDPDCSASGTAIPVICASTGTTCVGYGTAPNGGAPRSFVITPNADGGTTVTTFQQAVVGSTTEVNTTNVTVDPNGKVTQITGGITTGALPNPNATTATPGTPAQVSPAPGGTVVTPSAASITFPSDYARQGEAATAAAPIASKLDTIHTDLQTVHNDLTATTSIAGPSLPDAASMPWFGDTFTGLLSWQLPSHISTCPAPTVDLSSILGAGHSFTIDAHCALVTNNFQTIRSVMVAIFTVAALFLVLSA